jgi:hypothetical protein
MRAPFVQHVAQGRRNSLAVQHVAQSHVKNHGRRRHARTNNIAKLINKNPIISMTNYAALASLTGGENREAARFEAAHPELGHDFFIAG